MQLHREPRQFLGTGLGMGPGLRVPVPPQRSHDLVHEPGLTVGGGLHHPQVPRLDAEPPELGDERGHRDRLGVVRPVLQWSDEPVRLPLPELFLLDPGGGEQLRTPDPGGRGPLGRFGRGIAVPLTAQRRQRYGLTALHDLQVFPDHLQRQIVVPLHPQDVTEALDVVGAELAVPRGGPLRLDEPLRLQETDLGDGDFGKLVAQHVQHRADAHQPTVRGGGAVPGTAARCSKHGPSLTDGPSLGVAPELARVSSPAGWRRRPAGTCRSAPRHRCSGQPGRSARGSRTCRSGCPRRPP